MRRLAWALIAAGLVAWPAQGVGAEPQSLYRASSSAVGVHGFYDHEGLFPVPILNLSVPHTEARLEPGPSTESLGSFLWDPQAAELGTILCVLSEGRFCDVPPYPFQARATYPSAGKPAEPPTVTIDEPGAPIEVRAAHQEASATADGASAEASVARVAAVPMTPPQRAAAASLAAALVPAAGAVEPTRWLIEVREGVSTSVVRSRDDAVVATAGSELHGIRLLGGLVTISTIHGDARSTIGAGASEARSRVTGVRVAGLRAEVGRRGVVIDDRELATDQLRALNAALQEALAAVGMDVSLGRELVRRSDDSVTAEAFAFSLDFRRELLPEQFPDGTRGPDVVRLPLGFASAAVAVSEVLTPRLPPSIPEPPSDGGVAAGVQGIGGQPGRLPSLEEAPVTEAAPPAVTAEPVAAVTDLGLPAGMVLVIGLGALGLAVLLTWLKVNEMLTE